MIATGHYARVKQNARNGRYFISRGRDSAKDQSYALWTLSQDSLSRTVFPLADLTKAEARIIGEEAGLPRMDKGESYEICFIADNNYARFLKEKRPGLASQVEGGEIVMDGDVVGRHNGFPFYTIGQRRRIGVFRPEPLYVTGVDHERNRIEVGTEEKLYAGSLTAGDVNMQKYAEAFAPLRVHAKIRYKDRGGMATICRQSDGSLRVTFDQPRRAITPGQSVVFYEGDDLVGGGVINQADK
jgi:tRNA-specific 2-thiouridylase